MHRQLKLEGVRRALSQVALSVVIAVTFNFIPTAWSGEVGNANVVWSSPSSDSAGSMPLGNGDIGINAWVDPNGDLLMYVGKTDAWSENARLLKLGLIRVSGLLSPGETFRQEFDLRNASIKINAGEGADATSLSLWVDANNPAVQIQAESQSDRTIEVRFEPWRTADRQLTSAEIHSAYGLQGANPNPVIVTADTVVGGQSNRIEWYHRNESSIWSQNLQTVDLDPNNTVGTDPLLHNTFGAAIRGANLTNIDNTTLRSSVPSTTHSITIHPLTSQTATANEWQQQLDTQIAQTESTELEARQMAHSQWWNEFNNRSYIRVSGSDAAETVSQGYALQRAMNAFSGRGGSPIKFNGSIFVVDTYNRTVAGSSGLDADYRRWGGPYWWQNTRLPYWSMAASGDVEQMMPLFDMYLEALPLAKESVQAYWGHDGVYFPETVYLWGTPTSANYGWPGERGSLPAGTTLNNYIRYEWQGGIELSAMMLEAYNITRDDQFLQDKLLPIAESVVTFYDQHYGRDANGKLELSGDAQVLETWWEATNPLPEVAGLHFVLGKLLDLPLSETTQTQREQWTRLLGELPEIPTRTVGDTVIFSPGETFADKHNSENGELYGVFPYLISGVGKDNLQMGIDTYNNRYHTNNSGWSQDVIQAVLLGLTDQAKSQVIARYAASDPGSRFPGFYGPNFDWLPDQDHPSVANIALQKMILQVDGDEVELFPAWPSDWDVEFKLHGPAGQVFMGAYANGEVLWMDPTLDGRLDDEDIALINANLGYDSGTAVGDVQSLTRGDVNLDGRVDTADKDAVELGIVTIVPGDFDQNGVVNTLDWITFRDSFGADLSELSFVEKYLRGDMNFDGVNDWADFDLFKAAYNNANGTGAFNSMLVTVPEPATHIIAMLGALGIRYAVSANNHFHAER
ncbi:DUF5703 domain-containing protein [Aeoliella sp. ICT_H6.2]|uniref:DUF5703 domain-containing protein n=1 Tax=Aeoliella straminimaris TaxID=2954799 RepID=A0A9X2FF71_9BACT|nr:DUF5703 domain-containing protein [Aeoliella straminimaris]MCO6046942.1 DUF5703 domain-containing protein [Aeoliella straminimaris]